MTDSVTSSALSSVPDQLIEPSLFVQDLPAPSTPSISSSSIDDAPGLGLSRLPGFQEVRLEKVTFFVDLGALQIKQEDLRYLAKSNESSHV